MSPPLSANESQAGKTLQQRLVRAIYGETAYQIARRDGGVGSVDESLGAALISGKPFPALPRIVAIASSDHAC
jgi:hypothetical protein